MVFPWFSYDFPSPTSPNLRVTVVDPIPEQAMIEAICPKHRGFFKKRYKSHHSGDIMDFKQHYKQINRYMIHILYIYIYDILYTVYIYTVYIYIHVYSTMIAGDMISATYDHFRKEHRD